jgi:hypothetical protein
MSIFDTILGFVTGGTSSVAGGVTTGIVSTITDVVKSYWPPEMPPEKKAEAELAMVKAMNEKTTALMKDAKDADDAFNKRIVDLEGTASDLKSIPIIGAIMIFLRGCQRPIWGFATIYIDWMWLSNTWKIPDGTQQAAALVIINVLVLGFLFGERAIQNVMPYIIQYFGVKSKSTDK